MYYYWRFLQVYAQSYRQPEAVYRRSVDRIYHTSIRGDVSTTVASPEFGEGGARPLIVNLVMLYGILGG